MRIAFIGIGNVGSALADRLVRVGHEVLIATRDPGSATVKSALAKNPSFEVRGVQESVSEVLRFFSSRRLTPMRPL